MQRRSVYEKPVARLRAHRSVRDLNRATARALVDAHILDRERAARLVEYRDRHGDFKSWGEVKQVPGFEVGLVERLQDFGFHLQKMTAKRDRVRRRS